MCGGVVGCACACAPAAWKSKDFVGPALSFHLAEKTGPGVWILLDCIACAGWLAASFWVILLSLPPVLPPHLASLLGLQGSGSQVHEASSSINYWHPNFMAILRVWWYNRKQIVYVHFIPRLFSKHVQHVLTWALVSLICDYFSFVILRKICKPQILHYCLPNKYII